MRVIKAPERVNREDDKKYIFLAGSIEMGKAENWQHRVEGMFDHMDEIVILNPRRDDWDSSWEQKYENLQFKQQVDWEQEQLKEADWALFYFSENTQSPITLLELGTRKWDGTRTVVVCPEGYFRKGNVDIFCERESIHQAASLEVAVEYIKKNLKK